MASQFISGITGALLVGEANRSKPEVGAIEIAIGIDKK
jgi:hypothetical protein